MNTHILIPITEHLKEAMITGNKDYLAECVYRGKQISLDEEDQTKAAYKYFENGNEDKFEFNTTDLFINTYTQALKDLL